METLLERVLHLGDKIRDLESERETLKTEIKKLLGEETFFSVKDMEVVRKTQTRSGISKSQVPEEIWERYSTLTQFETLIIRRKKKQRDQ